MNQINFRTSQDLRIYVRKACSFDHSIENTHFYQFEMKLYCCQFLTRKTSSCQYLCIKFQPDRDTPSVQNNNGCMIRNCCIFEVESVVQKIWQAYPELNQRTAAKSASDYNNFFSLNLVLNDDQIRRTVLLRIAIWDFDKYVITSN